ncbi:MAG TPA: hypothetical protein VFQ88_10710 [Nevskiaceae bacterium]|nr:hypothetical protein [Nevskiaceae bacterium]
MNKNHTEDGKHGSKRTIKEMLGKAPYKRNGATGDIEKPADTAEKKVERANDDTRDACISAGFDRAHEIRRWARHLHVPASSMTTCAMTH